MRKLSPANNHRLGLLVLGMAVFITCGILSGAALAADAADTAQLAKLDKGKASKLTDTTALLEFVAKPEDGKDVDVAVFIGKEDVGRTEEGWAQKIDQLKPDKDKEAGEYTVLIDKLEADTPYSYRVRTTAPDGTENWSALGMFRTHKPPVPWYIITGLVVGFLAMVCIPFMVGNWLANRWRMPDYGWKLGVILFTLVWGVYFVSTRQLKLGIDLSGGVVLVYEMEEDESAKPKVEEGQDEDEDEPEPESPKTDKKEKMEKLVSAMALRVDPGGTRNVKIIEYGEGRVQVTIPRANPDEVKRIREKLVSAGSLEFRILADPRIHGHKTAIVLAEQSEGNTVWNSDGSEEIGWWVPVNPSEEDTIKRDPNCITRTASRRGKQVLEVLVLNDPYDVTGEYLSRSTSDTDQEKGRPCVHFYFNRTGGRLFGEFTQVNKPETEGGQELYRKLGIILNDQLYSAPVIRTQIKDDGIITGDFTREEVDDLVDVLNAGSLPTALKKNPISELNSGPELGIDTIQRGTYSIILSMIVVLAFMLVYYRFAGMVACGALLMNLILLLGIMMALKVDFTLPGIAGLVLTVGMAVDANVLIFERIREELAKQAALRMAIRNGFARALSAIVDANLTTLITATLLWAIGTTQIKGFAVVLWLGVVLSMFTAIFCSRVVFDIAERRRWIKNLNMMHIIRNTNINFIGMRYFGAAISITLIVIGLVSVVARGRGLLDIDFTGGEEVQLLFDKSQDIADVRKVLEGAKDANKNDLFPDLTVRDTELQGEGKGLRFVITTSKEVPETVEGRSAVEVVEADLHKTLSSVKDKNMSLATNHMKIGDMTTIGSSAEPKSPEPKKSPDPEAKTNTPEPDAGDQSRDDLPSSNVLAMADGPVMLLAQATPSIEPSTDVKPDEKSTDEPKTDAKPAEEAVKKAPEENTSEVKPTEAKPIETQPEPAEEQPAQKPEEKTTEQPVEEPVVPVDVPAPAKPRVAGRFEGGTKVNLHFDYPLDHNSLEDMITQRLANEEMSTVSFDLSNEIYEPGDSEAYPDWVLRIKMPQAELKEKILEPIGSMLAGAPHFPSSSSIGASVAGDMQQKAIYALLGSLICIIGYLWIRFQRVSYGLAAVVALVHDVLITLGALAISAYLAPVLDPFKISLSVLAAFLTIIGYSLNDTIVVFDRIREVKGKSPELTGDMINTSINQTLSRTLLTSLTTLIVVLILFFGGGSGLHPFAYSLLVGVIVGTYSSIFVASPVLHWMGKSPAQNGKNVKKA